MLPQDVDPEYGIAHSPLGPSPSQSPLAFKPFGAAPTAPPSAYSSAVARSSSLSNSGNLSRLSRSASQHATDSESNLLDPSMGTEGSVQHSDGSLTKSGRRSGDKQYSSTDHMGSGQLPAVAEVQTASERTDSEELSVTAETASQDLTVPSQQDTSEWANANASEAGFEAGAPSVVDEEAPSTSAQGK